MLEEYKGEKPENVIGLEEHKKRPFYKKVSFWVLSALGLFFASCSIYGLVLGSQYVRAVTEAAHIIADANENSSDNSSGPVKGRYLAPTPSYPSSGNAVNFSVSGNVQSQPYYICLSDGNRYGTMASLPDNAPFLYYYTNAMCGYKLNGTTTYLNRSTWNLHFKDIVAYNLAIAGWLASSSGDSQHFLVNGDFTFSGVFVFDLPSYYYEQGERDGYQDGYGDGYDTARTEYTNSTEVDFSVAAEMWPQDVTFTVSWYLDGQLEEQRSVVYRGSNGWSGFTFYREPLQVGRLVVESDSNTPFWLDYSNERFNDEVHSPSSLNEDNAYDFDNQKWYIPSYWSDLYVRINGGSNPPSDLYDIYIDPDHNDRARVGLWEEGYDQGYHDGMTNYGGQYDNGYNAGYEDGRREGATEGYNRGYADGTTGGKALMNMFVAAFQQPFNQIYRFLNFNLLGINLLSLFTALLTLSIGIIIIKKVL